MFICFVYIRFTNHTIKKESRPITCILLLLKKEPAYTSDIIQKLQEARLIVVEGTLYPLLTRLKNSGLLSYQWIESTQGPPRKYYQLTESGEEFLQELEASWQQLNDTINHIKNN